MRPRIQIIGLMLLLLVAGCGREPLVYPLIRPNPTVVILPSPQGEVVAQPSPTNGRGEEPTPSVTLVLPTFTATATPDPYAELTIEYLRERSYGGGELKMEEVLADNSYFTRYLVSYPSDGLRIYGFMNVPKRQEAPYPVVIAIHGYIEPEVYQTLDYTTGYADTLAREGFLVIHPNLRGYPPSDDDYNLFRVGMAEDILNLIALVKEGAGKPGFLEKAKPDAIGLWGHSMGGGISTRVMTVSPDVKAVVLYAAVSGDERQNYEFINRWSNGSRGNEELAVPEGELARISPVYFLDKVQAAVSIHHGLSDELVPPWWSEDTCQKLKDLGKEVECFTYPGQPHTFHEDGEDLFMQRVVEFYTEWLE